jgi:hypothetical protein
MEGSLPALLHKNYITNRYIRQEGGEMEKIKARGVKKGQTPNWKVGRKATGRERNKNISFRVTQEEKELIYKKLDEIGGNRTEALLKMIKNEV